MCETCNDDGVVTARSASLTGGKTVSESPCPDCALDVNGGVSA